MQKEKTEFKTIEPHYVELLFNYVIERLQIIVIASFVRGVNLGEPREACLSEKSIWDGRRCWPHRNFSVIHDIIEISV